MRQFLARRWFLLLLAGGVGLACLRPGWARPALDWLLGQLVVDAFSADALAGQRQGPSIR